MSVLNIILGVLIVIGAGYVLAMPVISSIAICSILSFFMLVFGIAAIFGYVEAKSAEKVARKHGAAYLKTGIGSLIFGIAAVVLAILARSSIVGEVLFMQLVSTVFGVWILLDGVSLIVTALLVKKAGAPGWLASMILGILIVLSGIFCIINCFAGLTAIGVSFGISMLMSGMAMIFSER